MIKRILFFIIGDIFLLLLAIYLAWLFRFDGDIPGDQWNNLLIFMVLALLIIVPISWFRKNYFFNWSYVGLGDLISLCFNISFGFLALVVLVLISREPIVFFNLNSNLLFNFPRFTIFTSYFLAIFFLGAFRIAKRVSFQLRSNKIPEEASRLLIVGAGNAGEQILRSIIAENQGRYLPVGFVDDKNAKIGTTIHGLKVLGATDEIPEIIKKYQIEEVFITIPSGSSKAIRKTVELCRNCNITKIKILPTLSELLSEKVGLRDIREIKIEDLLGRDPILFDKRKLENFIFDKVVLVTGAAGSIGSELSRQIAKFKPKHLIILDSEETNLFWINEELKENFPQIQVTPAIVNIQQKLKIESVFAQFQPQIIFHSAAYKHVPLMEAHPEEAVKNNILGTLICGEAAIKSGAQNFILISTDKSINPKSVMGASKRIAEMAILHLNRIGETKFSAVRFGNVLDSRGSVVPIFREQIKKGGPIKVTHPDMKRYFMAPSEAVLLVMQAAEMQQGGEVFVLDMGKPIKIVDFAKEMIRLSGFEPDKDIPIVFTGIRPGEKLFEEMLSGKEETTWHPKILKARLKSDFSDNIFLDKLQNIFELAKKNDQKTIRQKMREIVPEYNPN